MILREDGIATPTQATIVRTSLVSKWEYADNTGAPLCSSKESFKIHLGGRILLIFTKLELDNPECTNAKIKCS